MKLHTPLPSSLPHHHTPWRFYKSKRATCFFQPCSRAGPFRHLGRNRHHQRHEKSRLGFRQYVWCPQMSHHFYPSETLPTQEWNIIQQDLNLLIRFDQNISLFSFRDHFLLYWSKQRKRQKFAKATHLAPIVLTIKNLLKKVGKCYAADKSQRLYTTDIYHQIQNAFIDYL